MGVLNQPYAELETRYRNVANKMLNAPDIQTKIYYLEVLDALTAALHTALTVPKLTTRH